MRIKIGELAKLADCQVVTVRFYEKEGLLTDPERTSANYRLYGEKDIERLKFIKHCRLHGMGLAEIKKLLIFKDHPQSDCGWVNDLVAEHIQNVTEQISSLVQLKKHLEHLLHQCSGDKSGKCGIIKSLDTIDNCPYCREKTCHQQPQEA